MTQYVGALPSGQIVYFDSPEAMAAAGASNPNPIQLAQYAGSKGCNMAQGCATAYQATPPITQATLQQNGSTYNLVQGGQIQPAQVKVATDPTAQIFNIAGQQVAIGGSVLAGGVSGIQQALSGLGFATFSAGAGSTAPKIQENVPAGFARDALESINNVGRSVQQGATAMFPAFLMPGLSPIAMAAAAGSFVQQTFQMAGAGTASAQRAAAGSPAMAGSQGIPQPQGQTTIAGIASEAARDRPGYYALPGEGAPAARTIGDTRSATLAAGFQALSVFGIGPAFSNRELSTGTALELGRQSSYGRGDVRSAQYYSGEIQKLVSRPIEQASTYHHVASATGIPVPANPWEFRADLSVEFLKGQPQKPSEVFSPVSGQMSRNLPGGYLGIQQWSWQAALATDQPGKYARAPDVSYIPGLFALNAAGGEYGPYGTLFGGPGYAGTPSSEGIRKQSDFVFTADARRAVTDYLAIASAEHTGRTVSGIGRYDVSIPADNGAFTPTKKTEMARGPDGKLYPVEFMNSDPTNWVRVDENGRLIGSKTVAGAPVISDNVGGLPAPFRSPVAPEIPAGLSKFQQAAIGGYSGGLIGYALFGEKSPEVVKGFIGSGIDFAVGVATLGLLKPASGAMATTTPSGKVYEYGEYTKAGESLGATFRQQLGFNEAQLKAYGVALESKPLSVGPVYDPLRDVREKVVFGAGETLVTNPERVASAAIGGAALVIGGGIVGGAAETVAAGGSIAAPAARAAITGGQFILPALFTGAMVYSVTEGMTASAGRTLTNVGRLFPEVAGATLGGGSTYLLARGGAPLGFNIKEIDLRQTIDLSSAEAPKPAKARLYETDVSNLLAREFVGKTIERPAPAPKQPYEPFVGGVRPESPAMSIGGRTPQGTVQTSVPVVDLRPEINLEGAKINWADLLGASKGQALGGIKTRITLEQRNFKVGDPFKAMRRGTVSKGLTAEQRGVGLSSTEVKGTDVYTTTPMGKVLRSEYPLRISEYESESLLRGMMAKQEVNMGANILSRAERVGAVELSPTRATLEAYKQQQALLTAQRSLSGTGVLSLSLQDQNVASKSIVEQATISSQIPQTKQAPALKSPYVEVAQFESPVIKSAPKAEKQTPYVPPFAPQRPKETPYTPPFSPKVPEVPRVPAQPPAKPTGGFPTFPIPPVFGLGGGFGGGGGPGGGGRKYYGKFREVLMGINYGGFNIRSGTGAKRQSIKGKKSQQISFKNVSNVITGKRRKRK